MGYGNGMLLRRGDRGALVASVRARLASQTYLPPDLATPDAEQEFDDTVDAAVRAFQQRRGLIVDGIVGPATLRSLNDSRWQLGDRTLAYSLSSPMTGDDVLALQQRLAELGYDTGQTDGIFGPGTDRCVREFQRDRALIEDGVFGPETIKELTRMGRMVTGGRAQFLREQQIARRRGPGLRGKRIVIDPSMGGDDGLGRREPAGPRPGLRHRPSARGSDDRDRHGGVPHPRPAGQPDPGRAGGVGQFGVRRPAARRCTSTAAPRELAEGVATFHFGTDSGSSSTLGETLAGLIQREVIARTGFVDCRVHHKPWDILRLTQMPAVRVEVGYLSNPANRAALAREDVRDSIADGMLVAVKRLYLDGRDEPHTGTFTFKDLLAYEQGRALA